MHNDGKAEEIAVGISEHANCAPGFHGVLKESPYDFAVVELDQSAEEVTLGTEEPPEDEKPRSHAQQQRSITEQLSSTNRTRGIEYLTTHTALLTEEDGSKIADLLSSISFEEASKSDEPVDEALVGAGLNKASRSSVHKAIRSFFGDILDSEAVEASEPGVGASSIRILPKKSKKAKRKREPWPQSVPSHLHFTLYKVNRDTATALEQLARRLGTNQKAFGFAGTKDKRAVTLQRASVHRQRAFALARAASLCPNVRVGSFEYKEQFLGLGELSGNVFDITLRHVRCSYDTVEHAVNAIRQTGAINYFGLQRFGQATIYRTHHVGLDLLKGNWSLAIKKLLDPPGTDDNSSAYAAKQHYASTGDAAAAAKMLPSSMAAERAVLNSLAKSPNNMVQALQSIPKTMRMLYVHSYQSYLFNLAASARVEQHGLSTFAIAGDLVTDTRAQTEMRSGGVPNAPNDKFNEESIHRSMDVAADLDDTSTTFFEEDGTVKALSQNQQLQEDDHAEERSPAGSTKKRKRSDTDPEFWPVREVTKDEELRKSIPITDVLIPIPGHKTTLPGNAAKHAVNDATLKDSISLSVSPHNVREFSVGGLAGTYRPLVLRPNSLIFEYHSAQDLSLAQTHVGGEPLSSSDGASVRLRFDLGTGAYATMYIREITKGSTATADHKAFTQAEKHKVQHSNRS